MLLTESYGYRSLNHQQGRRRRRGRDHARDDGRRFQRRHREPRLLQVAERIRNVRKVCRFVSKKWIDCYRRANAARLIILSKSEQYRVDC